MFNLNEPPDELKGLTSEEMIQKIRAVYAYPDEAIGRIAQIVAEGRQVTGEEVAMADGRLCLRDYVPIRIAGKSYGRAWYHQDITERKRMEEELRRTRDELELRVRERTAELEKAMHDISQERGRLYEVLETLPVMICLLTADYRVAFVNRSFRERFGETRGRHCYEYCFGLQESCEFCEAYEPLKTGKPHHWELTAPDGTVIDAYDFPFTDIDGSSMVLQIGIDITDQRRLEEELRQAHKMEAIGTLAGGVAHDFNNILAAIIGFTEMAIDDVSDRPLVQKNLQNVMTSATRAKELVKQILAFSRKTTYDRAPLALSPIVQETIRLLRASIPATVDMTLSVTASSDTVIATPVEIQQIVMNFATNALLAMRDRRGALSRSPFPTLTSNPTSLPSMEHRGNLSKSW